MLQQVSALNVPGIAIKCPVPYQEKHNRSITPPTSNFTIGTIYSDSRLTPGRRQIQNLPSERQRMNLDSSLHITFSHCSTPSVSVLCTTLAKQRYCIWWSSASEWQHVHNNRADGLVDGIHRPNSLVCLLKLPAGVVHRFGSVLPNFSGQHTSSVSNS